MKQFAAQIHAAVQSHRLSQPFTPATVKKACPGWADRTYHNFLPKHRVGNPGNETELFVQVGPGLYRLK